MKDLQECITFLRRRIKELRVADNDKVSIHILSVEIALSLAEFSLNTTPRRAIEVCEEKWFDAGRFLELILINSEWDDIIDGYYNLIEIVKKNKFFRSH